MWLEIKHQILWYWYNLRFPGLSKSRPSIAEGYRLSFSASSGTLFQQNRNRRAKMNALYLEDRAWCSKIAPASPMCKWWLHSSSDLHNWVRKQYKSEIITKWKALKCKPSAQWWGIAFRHANGRYGLVNSACMASKKIVWLLLMVDRVMWKCRTLGEVFVCCSVSFDTIIIRCTMSSPYLQVIIMIPE